MPETLLRLWILRGRDTAAALALRHAPLEYWFLTREVRDEG
jgi:hypothetical protein